MIHVGQPDLTGNEALYVNDCIRRDHVTMDAYVNRFEWEFQRWLDVTHALACTSGTSALHLALLALGIGPGDAVIVPTLTFVATANAVRYTGAEVIFADVSPATWNITVQSVTDVWQGNVKAIIPVHLYGYPVDVRDFAPFGVPIIEDAAEALGGAVDGTKCGTLGRIGCFSFYGNKTITTGEGGMVVTNDPVLARRIELLRGQGQSPDVRYWHTEVGYNYRMTELQGALGCAQMERLDAFLTRRGAIAEQYRRALHGVTFQTGGNGAVQHAHWAVAVLLPKSVDRDGVRQRLFDQGIETRPVFYPVHTMPMYDTGQRLPNAEMIAKRGIVLPTHTGLTDNDIERISAAVLNEIGVKA